MNGSRLFTFGCSFTNYLWPTWANLLGREFDYFENWGKSAAGNMFIFNQLIECVHSKKLNAGDTAIIMWSSTNREDRYINNKWECSGNIYVSNKFGSDFTKKLMDDKGGLLKDLALISAAKDVLELRGIEYYFLSAFDLIDDYLRSRVQNLDNILSLHKNALDAIKPSANKVLFNNEEPSSRLPRPYFVNRAVTITEGLYNIIGGKDWPSYSSYLSRNFSNVGNSIINEILQREQSLQVDWHPTTLEHLEYLQKIFGIDVVSTETIEYAQLVNLSICNNSNIEFNKHLPTRL
jgi:hypothetical protein